MVYPILAVVFRDSLTETAWNAFEALATIVGFIAGMMQLWPVLVRLVVGRETARG